MPGATFYTIARPTAGVRRSGALYLPPPAASRLAPSFCRPTGNLGAIRYRNVISSFKLAAGTFALVAATLAIMIYQVDKQDTADTPPGRNETIVFRKEGRAYGVIEQMEASSD